MIGFLNSDKFRFCIQLLFIAVLLLGLFCKEGPSEFLGSSEIKPSTLADSLCSSLKLPSPDNSSKLAWPTNSLVPCEYVINLAPLGFQKFDQKKHLVLAVSGRGVIDMKIGENIHRIDVKSPQFVDHFIALENVGSPVTEINAKIKRIQGGVYLRSRVDIVTKPYVVPRVANLHLNLNSYLQIALVCALSLIVIANLVFGFEIGAFYLWCFGLSSLLFLSPKLIYYFDEWHIVERLSKLGISGVIHTHNEHSILAFFLWYYGLIKAFGWSYYSLLVISILLHLFCAYSIERLLLMYELNKKAVRASVLFFILSALHAEVLHWAFEQSIILSCICGIWALILLKSYLKSSNIKGAIGAGLLLVLSPLFFGNGFVFFPFAFLLVILELGFKNFKQYLYAGIMLFCSAIIPVGIYQYLKHLSAGHGVDKINEGFNILKLLNYFFTGSGLGTIGRGLGFYPNLTLNSTQSFLYEFLGYYVPWLDRRVIFDSTIEATLGIYCWLILGFVICILIYRQKDYRKFIVPCILGVGLIFLSFILPAVGRTHLGHLQSMSLRYQYSSMIGLAILMCPIFCYLLQTKISRFIFSVLILVWILEQSYLVQSFTYFTDHGDLHGVYVSELIDWDKKYLKEEEKLYEGEGEFQGLFPLARPSITPGSHPTHILKTAKWLRGDLD
jgi:hypothetical protein